MKHILDSAFRYKPSFDTDVRKTFDRVRRQQQWKQREEAKPRAGADGISAEGHGVSRIKVLQLDHLKKASST
jgi:hypothetical protein